MGKGHRVILANPGAGKSVLLLSKAFKYASMYKGSNVLLTCYNNNLADSYNFKRNCANFGENNNLFIMTFHKLVKKIYEESLKKYCPRNFRNIFIPDGRSAKIIKVPNTSELLKRSQFRSSLRIGSGCCLPAWDSPG